MQFDSRGIEPLPAALVLHKGLYLFGSESLQGDVAQLGRQVARHGTRIARQGEGLHPGRFVGREPRGEPLADRHARGVDIGALVQLMPGLGGLVDHLFLRLAIEADAFAFS